MVTDNSGNPKESETYKPYGSGTTNNLTTNYQWTGGETDQSGFYYFNARYYSPETGRFISVDPAVIMKMDLDLSIEEICNPYIYARNNPIRYIDPSGLSDCGIFGKDGEYTEKTIRDNERYLQGSGSRRNKGPVGFKDTFTAFIDGNNQSRHNFFQGIKDFFTSRAGFQAGLDKAGYIVDIADAVNAGVYAVNGELDDAAIAGIGALGIFGTLKGMFKSTKVLNVANGVNLSLNKGQMGWILIKNNEIVGFTTKTTTHKALANELGFNSNEITGAVVIHGSDGIIKVGPSGSVPSASKEILNQVKYLFGKLPL